MSDQKKILEQKDVDVIYPSPMQAKSGSGAAGAWLRFTYKRTDKVIAVLKYYGSSEKRDPTPNMKKAIKQGLIATAPGYYAATGLPSVPGVTLGKPNDDTGHIIGNQFGGYANMELGNGNVFPQDPTTNQGEFKTFEQFTVGPEVKKAGCSVCIRITFSYQPGSSTPHRPASFLYEWWIGPNEQPSKTFKNP